MREYIFGSLVGGGMILVVTETINLIAAIVILTIAAWLLLGGKVMQEQTTGDNYGRWFSRQRIKRLSARKTVGEEHVYEDYLTRYYLLPDNPVCNLFLHIWHASDQFDALHDHPWASVSVLIRGELFEITEKYAARVKKYLPVFRRATHRHRIQVPQQQHTPITIFLTFIKVREWFFWCQKSGDQLTKDKYHQRGGCP